MRLIVNADDLGYSRGVNCGIAEAHLNGIVTSATAMTNMPAFGHAMALARTLPALGIGLHFNITSGRPLGRKKSTLTNPDGFFKGSGFILSSEDQIDAADIEHELAAQMQALLQSGCRPTHIDSHHHVHAAPAVMDTVADYASRIGLPVRKVIGWPESKTLLTAPTLCTDFHAENVQVPWLISYLENCKEDALEIMTHPGFVDEALLIRSSYTLLRAKEHAVLTCEKVKAFITGHGIRLIRYDQI